jgi:hypothetical protein
MAAKPIRLTHKIAIQLHLVAEGCTICSSRSSRPVRKLLDTPSHDGGLETGYLSEEAEVLWVWYPTTTLHGVITQKTST